MPVKHGMLALLELGPRHGYQLKTEFEAATGGIWQLNIGQVYTTLQRLERDALITVSDDDGDDERRTYEITPAGRAALDGWYATPVVHDPPPRDELAIKILLAVAAPSVDTAAVIQRQRTASVEQLQALTRRKRDAHPERDLALTLHLDAQIMKAEADVRWLDVCEARVRHHRGSTSPFGDTASNDVRPRSAADDDHVAPGASPPTGGAR